ncbi:hypothetical protein BGZ61DRAFT_465395 [Ilyonectria robusta]|uniref:uncharacterized protein n=1 Tax=Ilyonectria robusta TaxID=1079257 RepID=UPI001E8E4956|nr:uncharacterized protein BGZ61DRAFT_465395 [Ilyonectria robusta]KAH8659469.1 hypothetical protein BGZ61DRAFT_465395 [Ilyonectria robusta]
MLLSSIPPSFALLLPLYPPQLRHSSSLSSPSVQLIFSVRCVCFQHNIGAETKCHCPERSRPFLDLCCWKWMVNGGCWKSSRLWDD